MENNYYSKYLKYKQKYIALKAQMGGEITEYNQTFDMQDTYATCGEFDYHKSIPVYCNCRIFIPENCDTENMNTRCSLCSHKKDKHNGKRINPLQKQRICTKQTHKISGSPPPAKSAPKSSPPPGSQSPPKQAPLIDGNLTFYINKISLDSKQQCSYKDTNNKYCNCPGFFPYCGISNNESDPIDDNKQCIFCGHTYNQHDQISYTKATRTLCK